MVSKPKKGFDSHRVHNLHTGSFLQKYISVSSKSYENVSMTGYFLRNKRPSAFRNFWGIPDFIVNPLSDKSAHKSFAHAFSDFANFMKTRVFKYRMTRDVNPNSLFNTKGEFF